MKWVKNLLDKLKGLTKASGRYPLTVVFLLAAAIIAAVAIHAEKDYTKQLMACAVGALLSASLEVAWERFFTKWTTRFILMGFSVTLTLGYYLILLSAPDYSTESSIRTSVILFALFIAFIWVPVIRSRISFNESFMTAFKSFFHSLLYSAVIYGGSSLIIVAIDTLIVDVASKAYAHIANIVFVLFAPLFFLSLIPVYPGKQNEEMESNEINEREERINKATFCPKFLEVLISYIVIPLISVFTIILLLYIVKNIRGEFWTNNLLEPMLVSYAVTVILVYILASRLENKFAVFFRRVFPKVLVPIVLFQIASSVLSLGNTGITHNRYFVIIFGVFAAASGIVMSLVPVKKNGIIAAMVIAFSIVSIIPPVDAFTVSRASQEKRLKSVLMQNDMLNNNTITPNASISDEDKRKIASSTEYLSRMEYTDSIEWLPKDFVIYEDFYTTFGFNEYDVPEKTNRYINVYLNTASPIDIAGYDVMTHAYFNSDETTDSKICDIETAGKHYVLNKVKVKDNYDITLMDDKNQEMIRYPLDEIFSRFANYTQEKAQISNEEATFTTENEEVKLTLVVQDANMNVTFNQTYNYADLYILVQIK